MKVVPCRLKSISVPPEALKKYLIPTHYHSAQAYELAYSSGLSSGSGSGSDSGLKKSTPNTPPPWVSPQMSTPYTKVALSERFPHIDFSLPWVVEFGTGTGDFLIHAATHHPDKLFIGVDVARPCVERAIYTLGLLNAREKEGAALSNILFYNGFALDFLQADFRHFPITEVLVNFPDPWPKKRHHKRRLISLPLITAVTQALVHGGFLITVTDVEPLYAYHLEVLALSETLVPVPFDETLALHDYYEFCSHYERKNLARTDKFFYTAHKLLS